MKIPGMKPAAKERPSKDCWERVIGSGQLEVWKAAAGLVAEEAGWEVEVGEAGEAETFLEHMPPLHV